MHQTFPSSRDRQYRSVFISDTHLGAPGVQAGMFLDFLGRLSCERLYLIGDIVDFWQMRRRVRWEACHGAVLSEILSLRKRGMRVTYIPGNHDWFVRGHATLEVGGIEVVSEAVHEMADGRRLLVVHGDQFDRAGKATTLLADVASGALHAASRIANRVRRATGRSYYPFSTRVRHRIRHLIPHVSRFEASAAAEAKRANLDGIVCGHLHIAALKDVDGVLYCNTGDWVDSCTAIREDHDGSLTLVDWAAETARSSELGGLVPATA